MFFLALCRYMVDCSARLRTHVADILNSQPTNVYCTTTNDKRWPYPDTLISENMVSFTDSPFKFLLLPPSRFLDPWRYCIQCIQNGEYSGGTESFVGSVDLAKKRHRPADLYTPFHPPHVSACITLAQCRQILQQLAAETTMEMSSCSIFYEGGLHLRFWNINEGKQSLMLIKLFHKWSVLIQLCETILWT